MAEHSDHENDERPNAQEDEVTEYKEEGAGGRSGNNYRGRSRA